MWIYVRMIGHFLRRAWYRTTLCLMRGHYAKFNTYPYCMFCGRRVTK